MRLAGHGAPWAIPGFIEARGGRLFMDGLDLAQLAGERGTPLYVYSARRLRHNARMLKSQLARIDPKTIICFASKALSAIKVLRLLREEGLSLEVNSGGEVYRAVLAGFTPSAIVFNGVAKSEAELAAALAPPIKAINVDSLFELRRLAQLARRLSRRARLALRITPGVESPTSPGNQTGSIASKFGLLPEELPAAIALLRAESEVLSLVGLHLHIGSQIMEIGPYRQAAEALISYVGELPPDLAGGLEHVNLGGGFPLSYMRGTSSTPQGGLFAPEIDASDVAAAVLPRLRGALGQKIEFILEPGRCLVGDAAVLLSRVENEKQRGERRWLYLDAGYNVIVESYSYKWYYHALTANKLDEPTGDFRLVGPLCDSGDAFFDVEGEHTVAKLLAAAPALDAFRTLLEDTLVRLPPLRRLAASTAPGDLIAFLDTGAYTLDQMTANNSRPRPEVGWIAPTGAYEVMRRRDGQADLLFNEVL